MALSNCRKFSLLILAACCVTLVKSLNINKEDKLEEIDEMFNEIEKNHHKLKQVIEYIIAKEAEDNTTNKMIREDTTNKTIREDVAEEAEECNCLPYYLCYPQTGEQITDGRVLLDSRVNSDQCDNPNDICCTPTSASSQTMKPPSDSNCDHGYSTYTTQTTSHSNCGYGYSTDTTPALPDDDPTLSTFGQFPWTVMISKEKQYTCVGSLIHPNVVLTAAHCVNTTDDITVRAGEWNINTKTEPFPHQNKKVIQVIKHSKFRQSNSVYDVALLITEEEFKLQENINTVCLTKATSDQPITNSDRCVATGWGIDKPNGRYNRIMKKIEFSLENPEQCQQTFRSTRLGNKFELHQSFLCAYAHDGSDACKGNGGAPLVCCMAKQPQRYQQVGIVSWGLGCAESRPSVFTDVSQIRDWVDMIFDSLGYSKEYYTA